MSHSFFKISLNINS